MFPFMQNPNSNSCKLIKREGRFVSSAHRLLKFISIHLPCVWLLVGNYNSKGIIKGREIFLCLDLIPDQINQCLGIEPGSSTCEGSLRLHWTVGEKWQGGPGRQMSQEHACLGSLRLGPRTHIKPGLVIPSLGSWYQVDFKVSLVSLPTGQ